MDYREELECDEPQVIKWRDINLVAESSSENRMVANIAIDDHPCRALLDTGALESMIDARWLQDHGSFAVIAGKRLLDGFGDSEPILVVGHIMLKVSFHGFKIKLVKFLVADTQIDSNVPVILGGDFMMDNKLMLSLSKKVTQALDYGSMEWYIGDSTAPCAKRCYHVACVATNNTKLPPREVTKVPVVWSGCGDLDQTYCSDCVEDSNNHIL